VEGPDDNMVLQQRDKPLVTRSIPTPVTASRHASLREERLNTADASMSVSLPPDSDSHTAIYDIAARTVYLPDGHRLEAHSGLGSHLDDPRYVSTKGQGPTPPNVYNLALRERLFHGVRAIRLVPVEDGKMFGRDGILAHSFMLGPSGQSNGCVSFRNYPAFLNAYLRGEVNRLVVVEHLATTTGAKAGSASGG
jgi:Tlde1 domain